MQVEHARLSPSSASRWMACPASIRLSEGIVERPSAYAQEGWDAHKEAESVLLTNGRKTNNEYIKAYVDFVRFRANGAKLLVEQRVNLSDWILNGFGTADAVIVEEEKLTVIDLKYGKGIKVDASNNPQLRLYALGVFGELELCYRFKEIETVVFQPRMEHVSTETLTPGDLLHFGETVRHAALATQEKNAPAIPGEKQCRWCPARFSCRARSEYQLALAEETFKFLPSTFRRPNTLDFVEIAALLPYLDGLISWAKDIKEYALENALKGQQIPGHKLVSGRAIRRWGTGAEDALKHLVPEDKLYKKKLVGIGEIEKILGKKHEVFSKITIKPAGKPALVSKEDKRPEYNSAAADFTTV